MGGGREHLQICPILKTSLVTHFTVNGNKSHAVKSGSGPMELHPSLEPVFSHPSSSSKGMKLGALQLALPRSFEISTSNCGLQSTMSCGLQANGFLGTSVSPNRRPITPMSHSVAVTRDDCAPVAEMKPRPRICRTRSTTYLETMFPC